MSDDYTPTTETVRGAYQFVAQEVDWDGNVVVSVDEAGAQFDRWLAAERARVEAEVRERIAAEIRGSGR